MKITFIKPNIVRHHNRQNRVERPLEPLEIGILAGLTPPNIDRVLYDDRIEPIQFDEATDLVAITLDTWHAKRAYEIAEEYWNRGVPVILGGRHATLAPGECQKHANSVCVGNAESIWSDVIGDLRRGALQAVYHSAPGFPHMTDLGSQRDLFQGKPYVPVTVVRFECDCRFQCEFCAHTTFFDRTLVARRTSDIVRNIEKYNQKNIFFVDDNFLSNKDMARVLLRELIPLRVRWISQASIDIAHDQEMLRMMAESGCVGNVFEFNARVQEPSTALAAGSGGSEVTSSRPPDWNALGKSCETLRSFGLQIWGSFTFGDDQETLESIGDASDFAIRNKLTYAAFCPRMPYPGTPFYARLSEQNRLLHNGCWWLDSDYQANHAAFIPRHMTPDELTEACQAAQCRWTRPAAAFRRFWVGKRNLRTALRWRTAVNFNPLAPRNESASREPSSEVMP